jgi:hypothetical protein
MLVTSQRITQGWLVLSPQPKKLAALTSAWSPEAVSIAPQASFHPTT